MKEFGIQVVGLLIIIFATMAVIFNPSILGINFIPGGGNIHKTSSTATGGTNIVIVSSDGKTTKASLSIEVADTPDKRGLGLGNRDSLGKDNGMLFLFTQPGVYDFWMKGMKFPIDFIWISSDQIVDTKSDAPPPTNGETELPLYHASSPVDKVLEVNAGFVSAHNIIPGDRIKQVK